MISFHRENSIVTMTANIDEYTSKLVDRSVPTRIVDILAKEWVEKYGADLIDQIAPEDMKRAISQAIAEKMFK